MRKKAIQRHEIADYLNVGTAEEPKWALMGYGFTTLDEEFGAESESAKYINEASASSSVVSYTSVFPFTSHLIPDEEAVNALYAVGRNHLTGEEAEFEYCRVELWDKKEEGKYAARKFAVSYTHLQVYAVKDQNGNIVNYGRSTSMKAVWANRKAKK